MKNEKAATPKSPKKNTGADKEKGKANAKVAFTDAGSTATEKAKPRSGRGLANEGTVVSYDEER